MQWCSGAKSQGMFLKRRPFIVFTRPRMCKEQALNSFRIPIVWECDPNQDDWDCRLSVLGFSEEVLGGTATVLCCFRA